MYRKSSSKSRTQFQDLNFFRLILQAVFAESTEARY